jgi:putative oxidoreductase
VRNWLLLPGLSGFSDAVILAIRLLSGAFVIHGVWDNIIDPHRMVEFATFLTTAGFPSPTIMAPLSVYAQFVSGVAVILGVLTRWAGLTLVVNFSVAVLMVHLSHSFREQWPAAVLVALGLLFATVGSGRFGVDRWLEQRLQD